MNELLHKICPSTIFLNITAIGISMTDTELVLKIISYSIAIIWTSIKVIKEIKNWNTTK
tara:strand:+ start:807 stop:983 length:177 start_codon:yes stop_codon:yes gene_type:complete